MSARVTVEGSSAQAETLRRLLHGCGAAPCDRSEAPDCVLVVHEPPALDAITHLATWVDADGLPRAPVVVVARAVDPSLRRAALRAGAMEVIQARDDQALDARVLSSAIEDAIARFAFLRPGDRPHAGRREDGASAASEGRARLGAEFARRVIDGLFAFVAVLELDGTLLHTNEAPLAAAGVGIEDVRGKKFWDCYWWSYSEEVRAQLRAACQRAGRGEVVRYDVVVRVAGDARMAVDFQVAPLFDDEGRVTHLLPSGVDITERKRAEAELLEREQRLAFHVENSPLAVVEWGADFRCARWTGQAEAMFGWRADEVLGRLPSEWPFVHEDDQVGVSEVMARLVTRWEARNRSANRNYRRDGSVGHYEWYNSARFDAQGRLVSVLSLVLDVTERRATERALLDSEARFRTIAEAAPSIVFVIGPEARGGYANSRWDEYFGSSFEEALRRGWKGTIHPDDEPRVLARWADCLRTGETFEVEYRLPRRDGEVRWHLSRAVPVRDGTGRVTGWCGTITDIHRLKLADEEIRRATDLLRAVTETVPDPFFAKDRLGRMMLANSACLRAIGNKTLEEVIGRTDLEWHTDKEQARAMVENDRRIMERGRGETVEERLTTPDGLRVFASVKEPLRGSDGEVVGIVGLGRDITEQKRAEAALRESEVRAKEAAARAEAERRLLDAVLEAAPAGIVVADHAGKLLRFNAAHELLWGLAPRSRGVAQDREYRGWWADESAREGRRLEADEWALARALRGETVRDDVVEIEPFDRPGTRRTLMNSAAPVRAADGSIAAAVVAQMDITPLIAAEAARRESEARFRALADNIAQLAWIADELGRGLWYNRRWFEYTGTTHDQTEGWGWHEVVHPDHVERVLEKLAHHFASGEPWEDTFPLRDASGEYRWFLSRAIPIRDTDGRVVRWFGTNTDVTAQREAEEALRAADQRKDEFIAVLAHELRNPLAPVRSAVEILRMIGTEDPNIERARGVIDRQVTHMVRLIDDLLDVSRIARGKLTLRREMCDVAAIARQTAEDYRASFERAGLTLEIETPGAPVEVMGDPVRLAQMVGNLLQNAERFTPRGGRVEVRARADRDAHSAEVSVSDTGVGIAPELAARLFDPFSQADQGLARSKGGLGLGLALTRGLAEAHGGGVTVESGGEGDGATFTLRIPLRRARRGAPSPASAPSSSRAPLQILLVEDNRDAAETLADLLALRGHRVTLAFDGASGVAKAHELRPDVLISDIGLPGELDGYDVARAVRAEPSLRHVRLVALSGYANLDDRRRSREAGFEAHLAKPPHWSELERALAAAKRS